MKYTHFFLLFLTLNFMPIKTSLPDWINTANAHAINSKKGAIGYFAGVTLGALISTNLHIESTSTFIKKAPIAIALLACMHALALPSTTIDVQYRYLGSFAPMALCFLMPIVFPQKEREWKKRIKNAFEFSFLYGFIPSAFALASTHIACEMV